MLKCDVEFEHLDCKKKNSQPRKLLENQHLGGYLIDNSCFQSNPQRTGGFHESTSKRTGGHKGGYLKFHNMLLRTVIIIYLYI
jgi:hypothetical protein